MTTFAIVPARSIAAVFGRIGAGMTIQFGDLGPAERRPRRRDIRHLDDHLLKDIGFAREDRMSRPARDTLNRLFGRPFY